MDSLSIETLSTSKGKPCLVIDGYQYRKHRSSKIGFSWLCVKQQKEKCKVSLKTDFENKVICKTDHTCVPNSAELEIKKTMEKCRKRVREDISVPVSKIFQEEISAIYEKGYDLACKSPKYENAKTQLCRERRVVLGTVQNPKTSADIDIPEDILKLPNNGSFLLLDIANDDGKRILIFGGEDAKNLLQNGELFFMDGTFKSCSKQFAQLYTIHVDCGSTISETNVYPAIFALLPDKKENTYYSFFSKLKDWCASWNPVQIKLDFETSAMNAIRLLFPETVISGCSFHYTQALWRKIQELGLALEYKNNDEIRQICRMCSALAYLPLNLIDDAWLIIMEITPAHEKLSAFIDYFVLQWMDNPNIPKEMWNVYGQRHRSNNPVEGWNSKLNSMVGMKSPNIYLLIRKLKEESKIVSLSLQKLELGESSKKRRKAYVRLDERIGNILNGLNRSNDLKKALIALSYVTKMGKK